MDKEYAIKFLKEHEVSELIDVLLSNGNSEDAMDIINNCWGDTDEEVADYIEENWNF